MVDAEGFVGEVVAVVKRGSACAFGPDEFVPEDVDKLRFVFGGDEVVVHQDATRRNMELFHIIMAKTLEC